MPTAKTPDPSAPRFERGPAVAPSAELVAWLDAHADRVLRVPVTITLGPGGSIQGAVIGVNGEPGPVVVELSDLQMGISLKDRLRKVCKGGGACAVWLIGRWSAGSALLNVRALDGAVAEPAAATHVEVEAP